MIDDISCNCLKFIRNFCQNNTRELNIGVRLGSANFSGEKFEVSKFKGA